MFLHFPRKNRKQLLESDIHSNYEIGFQEFMAILRMSLVINYGRKVGQVSICPHVCTGPVTFMMNKEMAYEMIFYKAELLCLQERWRHSLKEVKF